MIEAKNMSLIYGDGTVGLKDVNLKIDAGDIVYITGPSGSGKTSLLKLFMGIEYPTMGELNILNLPITKERSSKIRKLRRIIGPVFQEFKLIKGRTSLENTMIGMRFIGLSNKQIKEASINALCRVGLEHKIHSLVEHLSFGETQRVAIARAVARKPAIILADEPTGNLDLDNAINILELLTSFKDKDTTVIITTHATHLISDIKEGKFIQVDKGSISVESRGEA
ncbi:ATP-binding cassette domain-containing protein [Tissierella sp.]|uniref:cell division ATP-binding protein FtsE n=1 Tax=Tissierella sp. TaxID=41274 RepID=UPI002863E531|nr:ATP-binding cassette domain-containing protein [Tissierella sp.]MDR7855582.1 ATP-binding cassette domain-containing protein [Tissierella sp.]